MLTTLANYLNAPDAAPFWGVPERTATNAPYRFYQAGARDACIKAMFPLKELTEQQAANIILTVGDKFLIDTMAIVSRRVRREANRQRICLQTPDLLLGDPRSAARAALEYAALCSDETPVQDGNDVVVRFCENITPVACASMVLKEPGAVISRFISAEISELECCPDIMDVITWEAARIFFSEPVQNHKTKETIANAVCEALNAYHDSQKAERRKERET